LITAPFITSWYNMARTGDQPARDRGRGVGGGGRTATGDTQGVGLARPGLVVRVVARVGLLRMALVGGRTPRSHS